jgi:hypothetical protein
MIIPDWEERVVGVKLPLDSPCDDMIHVRKRARTRPLAACLATHDPSGGGGKDIPVPGLSEVPSTDPPSSVPKHR